MVLFMRKFNKVMKWMVSLTRARTRTKLRESQRRPWFGCGKEGHFIADCSDVKIKRKNSSKFDKSKYKRKTVGEAHLGQEYVSNKERSDSNEEVGLSTMVIRVSPSKSSLFEHLTNDEDDFTHTCLMASPKVDSETIFLMM